MSEQTPLEIPRTVVLVGLMGAGKTSIGRELGRRFQLPFTDADEEIETAAGCSIEDIFSVFGEGEFRKGERRVIARLLELPTRILATGGGAFMDPDTRARIRDRAISVWLKADLPLLLRRVQRRTDRPLLKTGDQRATLERLIAERYPVYAEADLVVETTDEAPRATVERAVEAIEGLIAREKAAQTAK